MRTCPDEPAAPRVRSRRLPAALLAIALAVAPLRAFAGEPGGASAERSVLLAYLGCVSAMIAARSPTAPSAMAACVRTFYEQLASIAP